MTKSRVLTHLQHRNSKAHHGTNVACPFCETKFTAASGVSHHLENGSCTGAPDLNRETILEMIRQRDPNGTITVEQIERRDEGNVNNVVNGNLWECYICHDQFNSSYGLNMHLNSPRHKDKEYHCPNEGGGCVKEFVSLAALFSHLESEACSFMKFEEVQQQVGSVLQGRNMISF